MMHDGLWSIRKQAVSYIIHHSRLQIRVQSAASTLGYPYITAYYGNLALYVIQYELRTHKCGHKGEYDRKCFTSFLPIGCVGSFFSLKAHGHGFILESFMIYSSTRMSCLLVLQLDMLGSPLWHNLSLIL
jgi:hypothetical protein